MIGPWLRSLSPLPPSLFWWRHPWGTQRTAAEGTLESTGDLFSMDLSESMSSTENDWQRVLVTGGAQTDTNPENQRHVWRGKDQPVKMEIFLFKLHPCVENRDWHFWNNILALITGEALPLSLCTTGFPECQWLLSGVHWWGQGMPGKSVNI